MTRKKIKKKTKKILTTTDKILKMAAQGKQVEDIMKELNMSVQEVTEAMKEAYKDLYKEWSYEDKKWMGK